MNGPVVKWFFSEGGVKTECRMSNAERNPKPEIRKTRGVYQRLANRAKRLECAGFSGAVGRAERPEWWMFPVQPKAALKSPQIPVLTGWAGVGIRTSIRPGHCCRLLQFGMAAAVGEVLAQTT